MATTLDFTATATPANIVADLSLTDGTRYTVEVADPSVSLYIREQVAAPSTGDDGHRLRPGERGYITPEGTPIWAWSKSGDCSVVISPAVG